MARPTVNTPLFVSSLETDMLHKFLFAPLDSREPLTARKVHIHRLYDVLQLSIHRNDLTRATRAWCILIRCKEVHWMSMWTTGLHLLGADIDEEGRMEKRLEYLRMMMLRNQDDVSSRFSTLSIDLSQLHFPSVRRLSRNWPFT